MTLEAGKEMDRRCVLGWLNEVYRNPTVAFNTYSDKQQIEFAHDALVLLNEQEAAVRCKDCKHYRFHWLDSYTVSECPIDHCENPDEYWFCADGERAENAR